MTKNVKLMSPTADECHWFAAWLDSRGHRELDWCQTREQAEESATRAAAEGLRHAFVGRLEAAAVVVR